MIKKGDKYGRWEVINFSHSKYYPKSQRHDYYLCVCECGVTRKVRECSLKSGRSSSCGCRQREVASKQGKEIGPTVGLSAIRGYYASEQHSRPHREYLRTKAVIRNALLRGVPTGRTPNWQVRRRNDKGQWTKN